MSLRRPPRAGREGQLAVFGTAGGEIGGHYNRGNGGGQPAFDAFDEQSGAPLKRRGAAGEHGGAARQAPPAAARGSTRLALRSARRVMGRQLFSALLDRLGV